MAKTGTILDQYGNPIDRSALKQELAGATTTGVRTLHQGHPSIGLSPQRLASILRESENEDPIRYLELAEEMEEKYPHYLAVLNTRKLQVTQLDITVVPADDSAEAAKHADLVRSVIEDDALQSVLSDVMDALGKGFSVVEIGWDTSEGQWRPSHYDYRLPGWFAFDRDDGKTLRLRDAGGQLVPLQPYKFIQHRHKAKSGLPIRGGLARAAAWTYLFANYGLKDWVTFAEVYGHPLRVGKYQPSATEAEKETLLRAVANIGADAGAIIPASMIIEFIERGATGDGQLYERMLNRLDYGISKMVLGQTTTTDAVSGGHAVSKEHNQVRGDIEASDAKQLAASLVRDVVKPVIDLNYGQQKAYPKLLIGRPDEEDLKQLTEAVGILVPLGLQVSQDELRGKLGLSKPKDGEQVLQRPAAPAAPGADDDAPPSPAPAPAPASGGGKKPPKPELASMQPSAPALTTVLLTERGVLQAQPVIDGWVEKLREALEQTGSLDDALYKLLDLAGELPPDQLGEIVAAAMGTADLAGRFEVLTETGLLPITGERDG